MMPVKQLHFHPYIIICSVFLWSCIPLSGFKLPYLNWDLFWVSSRWFLSDMRPVKQLQGHVFCCRLTYCLLSLLDCPSWRLARVGVVGCTSVLLVSQRSLSCCCQLAPDLDQLGLLCLSNESVLCNYSPLSMQRLIKLFGCRFLLFLVFCFVFLANLLLSHHSALAFFIKKMIEEKKKKKLVWLVEQLTNNVGWRSLFIKTLQVMVDCMGWRKLPELQGLEEVIAWVDGNCQNYRGWKRLLHGLTETARTTGVGRGYCMGWRKLPELQGLEEVIAWVDGNCQNYRGWKRLLHGLTETARTTGVGRGYCMGWQKLPELQGLEEVIAWVDGNWQNYRGWKRLLHGLTETARTTGVGRGYIASKILPVIYSW